MITAKSASDISDISDEMMTNVAAPAGWDIVTIVKQSNTEIQPQALAEFKKTIDRNLNFVTEKVDILISKLHRALGVDIYDSYLVIDADAAFHIFFLVDKDVYQSPSLIAARIMTATMLNSSDTVGIRYTFTIAGEYANNHTDKNTYKLKRNNILIQKVFN